MSSSLEGVRCWATAKADQTYTTARITTENGSRRLMVPSSLLLLSSASKTRAQLEYYRSAICFLRNRAMTKLFLAIHAFVAVIAAGVVLLSPAAQVPAAPQASGSQKEDSTAAPNAPMASDLPLAPALQLQLKDDLGRRDYKDAEQLLLAEAERDPKSVRAAKLLSIAGGIFFLDRQYTESVDAWKNSEAIAPLDDRSRFTRAMAFIHINRRDLALPELEKLTAAQPENPLYLYWLARLDYDRRDYNAAINKFQKVIALDPKMARAYDLLGFCHEYVGKRDD